jgi:hypothetical protein
MNNRPEEPLAPPISGTWVQLGERESIAIYVWNDLSWVAHFRGGSCELSDAAMWFKTHAEMLRSHWVAWPAALESVQTLTPEMVARIARLHQLAAEEQTRREAASAAFVASLGKACARAVSALRGWRARLTRQKPPETASPS